jgi:hypothetical protein
MGFFSGLTLGGLTGAVGRMASRGGGPFGPGASVARPGGGDLLDRLRTAMDPERLAIAQALIAGDYGAVSRMTEPLRRQRLAKREQLARSELQREAPSPDMSHGAEPYPAASPAFQDAGAGSELGMRPITEPNPKSSLMKSGAFASAGQDDPMTRQMATHPEPENGQRVGRGIVDLARGLPAQAKPSSPPEDPAIGRRIFEEKLRRGGGLNYYDYIPSEADVNWMARALYSEFGQNDNWEDMPAGAWSIINRIRPTGRRPGHRYELGDSIVDVLEGRGPNGVPQYSFMPSGGVHAPGGSQAWQESAHPERMTGLNRKAWAIALQTARDLVHGQLPDPTAAATHFHNDSMGVPPNVRGWFGDALREGDITLSPYRSPTGENYFYRVTEDPARPLPTKAARHQGR